MPVVAESSSSSSVTIAEHIRLRRPRYRTNHYLRPTNTIAEDAAVGDPMPELSRFCKSTTSSFFLLPTSLSSNETTQMKKKPTGLAQTSPFRGLGCSATAPEQVSVPAVIRSTADWEAKKVRKKKNKKNHGSNNNAGTLKIVSEIEGGGCVAIPDVWCGPGIGFSTDAIVGGSVDPVGSSAPRRSVPGRRKIDGERTSGNRREGSSFFPKRSINSETLSFLTADSTLATSRPELALFSSRYPGHARHPLPTDLAEITVFENDFLTGGRTSSNDHFHAWRLDVDNMTYEQLLELGDRIGYVGTGLKEDEINSCLRRIKPPILNTPPAHLTTIADKKCSICQEEYEEEDEKGKLNCGHNFHIQCIKQWLSRKNACPVCKIAASPTL